MNRVALLLPLVLGACKAEKQTPAPPAPSAPAPSASAATSPPKARAKPKQPEFIVTKTHQQKRLSWRQIAEVNWQAVAKGQPALLAEKERDGKWCEPGMLPVEGRMLLDAKGREDTDEVLLLQNRACSHFLTNNRGVNALCDRFDRGRWLELSKDLPRKPIKVCIDRYEFPNVYGEYPLVVVRYAEAKKYCEGAGKRLCTESEWTLACEGEEGRPYPYGYERDETVCRIGILAAGAPKNTFAPRTLPSTARGIDFAWQGKRAGESPNCVSPYGAEDMTGNVDEWTKNVRRYGYEMIMKGGHWGPARQRCRPQTRGHGPNYVRYDQGFRCCKG